MDSAQIRHILRGHPGFCRLKGAVVTSRDRLPRFVEERPYAVVANTEDADSGRAGHWICFYFPEGDRNGYFFDSLGQMPRDYGEEFQSFLFRNSDILVLFSREPLQLEGQIVCGEFCLWFLYYKLSGLLDVKLRNLLLDINCSDVAGLNAP